MNVGLIASPQSPQARRLFDTLGRLEPGAAGWFDISQPGEDRIALDSGGVRWNGVRVDGLDAVWIHGFRYQDPVMPLRQDVDWSLWQSGHLEAQQRQSFLFSLLSRIEASSTRLLSPVSAHLAIHSRFADLRRRSGQGVAVPDLMCTNDRAEADAFRARHQAVVWRAATGRAMWQSFGDRQRDALMTPGSPPIILAAVVPGPLARVYALEGAVALAVTVAAPDRSGVERLETFHPIDPSDHGLGGLACKLAEGGLPWAMAQCVMGPDGPVLYDLDPDPILTELPEELAEPLFERLALSLLGRPWQSAVPERPTVRPALFLRRMLQIQFDMEQSKHRS